jgi:flagellar motor switch protein FliN
LSQETQLIDIDPDPGQAIGRAGPAAPAVASDPFASLPRLTLRQVRLDRLIAGWTPACRLPSTLRWLDELTGAAFAIDRREIVWRASGLMRPSLVVQFSSPMLGTRLALGIEVPLAHNIVDRLLGFDRDFGESRFQLTPVEWGIWTFLALRALAALSKGLAPEGRDRPEVASSLYPRDLTIDRVGPDPPDLSDLGSILTVRWSVRIGSVVAAVRLWLAEAVVDLWTESFRGYSAVARSRSVADGPALTLQDLDRMPLRELAAVWRALAGRTFLPQGLRSLRAGVILPLRDTKMTGSAAGPTGCVDLVVTLDAQAARFGIPASPVAGSAYRLLCIEGRALYQTDTRGPKAATILEGNAMNPSSSSSSANPPAAPTASLDVPVTLTVELGRVNLTVTQLADLKPGDVVELNRHSRAPVELTSNGRLVARGELVQIDTDLGVRVMSVFL